MKNGLSLVFFLCLLCSSPTTAFAQKEKIDEITTRGQKMRFLLTTPAKPVGSVILMAGGHGNLSLTASGRIGWGEGNQLVRTRADYAKSGFVTATPDIAADLKEGEGGVPRYRWSEQHAADIGTLIQHLREARPARLSHRHKPRVPLCCQCRSTAFGRRCPRRHSDHVGHAVARR